MTADRMLQTAKQEHNLLDNYQSANFLGFSPATMRNSRYTGLLAGVPAPSFRKLGRNAPHLLLGSHSLPSARALRPSRAIHSPRTPRKGVNHEHQSKPPAGGG